MVFGLFKKKNEKNELQEFKMSETFSKLDSDIKLIQQWVFHLSAKSQEIDASHKMHSELAKKDVDNIKLWISFLNQHSQELKTKIYETQRQISRFEEAYSKLNSRIESLENQSKSSQTAKITGSNQKITSTLQSQPFVTDNYVSLNSTNDLAGRNKSTVLNHPSLTSSLAESEKRMLNILLNSTKPTNYNSLAKNTSLNYGTVKNIICSLRKKGIKINDAINPYGEKEFFLNEEARIEITGR